MAIEDQIFLRIAIEFGENSHHPRFKVGAVIVQGSSVIARGFNRLNWQADHSSANVDQLPTIHAEMAAVLNAAREDLVGATLYVSRPPCA